MPCPLVPALLGDAESCREQESPEGEERVVKRQTEEEDVSFLAPTH